MGWVESREGRRPRACWRPLANGPVRRRTADTVEQCEQILIEEEGDLYVEPALRKGGRPAIGSRGHTPSLTSYVKDKCRCPRCLAFYADYRERARERKKQELRDHPEKFVHGSNTTYGLGCDCDPCKAAGKRKNDARRSD